jgi:hypothetical protein
VTRLQGEVVAVEGNNLVVRMADGEIRQFSISPDQRFLIDGQDLRVNDLEPGTQLTAEITNAATSTVERTVERIQGTVWFASGPSVILTLDNGENRQYTIKDDKVKFIIDGREASVFDLRKGMRVSAERITEAPQVQIVRNTVVTGSAPVAETAQLAQAAPAPTPTPAPQPARTPAPRPEPSSGTASTAGTVASPSSPAAAGPAASPQDAVVDVLPATASNGFLWLGFSALLLGLAAGLKVMKAGRRR